MANNTLKDALPNLVTQNELAEFAEEVERKLRDATDRVADDIEEAGENGPTGGAGLSGGQVRRIVRRAVREALDETLDDLRGELRRRRGLLTPHDCQLVAEHVADQIEQRFLDGEEDEEDEGEPNAKRRGKRNVRGNNRRQPADEPPDDAGHGHWSDRRFSDLFGG